MKSDITFLCRRWRHYGGWPGRWHCSVNTDCLTHSASAYETWAAEDCSAHTDPDPDPDSNHHCRYLLHHSAHLHPAQSPSEPASAAATPTDSCAAGVQTCSPSIQHPHHPQSATDPHPSSNGHHAQPTPNGYCTRFSVASLGHPSCQSCHPGRGSQTHCPPGSLHHRQLCAVSPRPPVYQPHHCAPGGPPRPAPTCPLSPTGGRPAASCRWSHCPHHKPHPPSNEWHRTKPTSCRHHWQADSGEHPNGGPPPAAGGSDGTQPCDDGDHALVSDQHSEAGLTTGGQNRQDERRRRSLTWENCRPQTRPRARPQ